MVDIIIPFLFHSFHFSGKVPVEALFEQLIKKIVEITYNLFPLQSSVRIEKKKLRSINEKHENINFDTHQSQTKLVSFVLLAKITGVVEGDML